MALVALQALYQDTLFLIKETSSKGHSRHRGPLLAPTISIFIAIYNP